MKNFDGDYAIYRYFQFYNILDFVTDFFLLKKLKKLKLKLILLRNLVILLNELFLE